MTAWGPRLTGFPRETWGRSRWGGEGLSLAARVEVTKGYASQYAAADKKLKGLILGQVALKCLYLVTRLLGPIGGGRTRWVKRC